MTQAARLGDFNYLAASVEHSLYRNGKVLTRRDLGGNDAPWQGADLAAQQLAVRDARGLPDGQRPTLQTNGFELIDCPMTRPDIDFLKHDQVVSLYYPACAQIIQKQCGAATVVAFDHNIRSVSGHQDQLQAQGGQQVQPPLHMVHGDYTLTSAPQRLRDLSKPPTINDTFRSQLTEGQSLLDAGQVEQALSAGRFAIINLWRNIAAEPVAAHPLAFCDATSVNPDDLVVFEIHYADRIGENYYAKHADQHRWFYYPQLTRDEAVLIKQWDSAGQVARSEGQNADSSSANGPCTFSFHSAFDDPATPIDAPDRWSIEVRCVAIYG